LQILDFSRSQLVSIDTGLAKIQEGNFNLIHSIDLKQFENFAFNLEIVLRKDMIRKHPKFQYLRYELTEIEESINNLKFKNKQKRSIDILGTIIKYIAGNPDKEDFEIIKNQINNVINTHNTQVTINKKQNERIQQITEITNKILNFIHSDNKFNDQLCSQIQYQLKLMKENLLNIKQTIHWAKQGVVNSQILSKEEINEILYTLEKDKIPYKTIEEAIDFAQVSIISNHTHLFFLIKIPLTTPDTYSKLLLKPIKNKNTVNEIKYENILLNKNNMFGIKNFCKTINNITICKQNDIVNISNSTCIPNILKSLKSSCNIINNQHVAEIDEISPGIILLNQFNGIVENGNISHPINGTFLINFYNTTVKINGQSFIARERPHLQILPAILQPTTNGQEFRELLSLEFMKEVQINNTKTISIMQGKHENHQIVNYGLTSAVFILVLALTIDKIRKLAFRHKNVEVDKTHVEIELKTGEASTSAIEDQVPRRKFYEV